MPINKAKRAIGSLKLCGSSSGRIFLDTRIEWNAIIRLRHSSNGGYFRRGGVAFVNDRFATAAGGEPKARH
jgi:hypothetical protein